LIAYLIVVRTAGERRIQGELGESSHLIDLFDTSLVRMEKSVTLLLRGSADAVLLAFLCSEVDNFPIIQIILTSELFTFDFFEIRLLVLCTDEVKLFQIT